MTQDEATSEESTAPDEAAADDSPHAGGATAESAGDGTDEAAGGDADELDLVARVAAHDEELAAEVAEVTTGARRVADLESEIDALEVEKDDLEERLRRTQADFQNYKKRAKKRQEQLQARATEDLVERLLDVRDNLSRALDDESGDVEGLREGVELTLAEFDRVLDDEGVGEIAPEPGDEVDPTRHEVLMRVESDRPADTVAEVYRPGYEMGEKVLQTAQVTVSDGADDDEE